MSSGGLEQGNISHLQEQGSDTPEQQVAIVAYLRVIMIDEDLIEEPVDRLLEAGQPLHDIGVFFAGEAVPLCQITENRPGPSADPFSASVLKKRDRYGARRRRAFLENVGNALVGTDDGLRLPVAPQSWKQP